VLKIEGVVEMSCQGRARLDGEGESEGGEEGPFQVKPEAKAENISDRYQDCLRTSL
jgi:hypothetical protein